MLGPLTTPIQQLLLSLRATEFSIPNTSTLSEIAECQDPRAPLS